MVKEGHQDLGVQVNTNYQFHPGQAIQAAPTIINNNNYHNFNYHNNFMMPQASGTCGDQGPTSQVNPNPQGQQFGQFQGVDSVNLVNNLNAMSSLQNPQLFGN
jgi:hypothetical protein